eukprot:40335-Pyramimonas_sp.AAC.3
MAGAAARGSAPGWRARGTPPCRGPPGGACGAAGTVAWAAARAPPRTRAATPPAPHGDLGPL